MMAYQCDICGSFYNKNALDVNNKIDPFTGDPLGFARKTLATVGSTDSDIKERDVCPSCMNAIQYVCTRINKEGGSEWLK